MRYFFWLYINEIFLYPLIIAIVSPLYLLLDGELWAVAILAISLCLLSSVLTRHLGRHLITLTAAKVSVLASKDKLERALNRLIYLSRLLPAIRDEVRDYCFRRRELDKAELMELAMRCMNTDAPSLKPIQTFIQLLYYVGLGLSVSATILRLIS